MLPAWALSAAVVLLGAGVAAAGRLWWRGRAGRPPRPGRTDPVQRAWLGLCELLKSAGIDEADPNRPLELAERAAVAAPDLASSLEPIAREYLRLGAAATPSAEAVARTALLRSIRRLQPRLRHRSRLQALPGLPPEGLATLQRQLPLYRRMPQPLRQRCAALTRQLLARVRFEGCGALVVTDPMRHVIGFQAALLVANRGLGAYAGLRSILVYPDEFVVPRQRVDEAGVVTQGHEALAGQSEETGRVLLSWWDIEHGLAQGDGYNVVLHEFAHLLDHAVGGELSQRPGSTASTWHDVLEAEYTALCDAVDAGADTLIDPYGSEDPAEFFAVCTETFFELPEALLTEHPALYRVLAAFYGTDPASWACVEPA
jgi:MtfA peptidase